jgi:hypothetical protein
MKVGDVDEVVDFVFFFSWIFSFTSFPLI